MKGNGCIRENTSKNENEKNGEGEYGHGEESNPFWMLFLFVCLFGLGLVFAAISRTQLPRTSRSKSACILCFMRADGGQWRETEGEDQYNPKRKMEETKKKTNTKRAKKLKEEPERLGPRDEQHTRGTRTSSEEG